MQQRMSLRKNAPELVGDEYAEKLQLNPFQVHHKDARELLDIVSPDTVDVTITSPPYFDLKDYGSTKQIGFGQDYAAYLADLRGVFEKVYTATRKNGSLWIIIDTFRRAQELLPLPFDLAAELKKVGWSLKDVIIWKKERTVPWIQTGATRNIFEYVLVFAKQGESHQYFPDRQREIHDLKHWWVKYPERYNQKGKSLEEIWSFDIPTQGAWGDGYVRHFCPLPEGLVQRIIDLTTNRGQIVLDPFAGSGTVPAQAHFMGREFIGFELNKEYIDGFKKYIAADSKKAKRAIDDHAKQDLFSNFEEKIVQLRVLKLGRILLKELRKDYPQKEIFVFAEKLDGITAEKFKITSGRYTFFVGKEIDSEIFASKARQLLSVRPYSKFGVQAEIKALKNLGAIEKTILGKGNLFCYTITNSHQFKAEVSAFKEIPVGAPVISHLRVDIDEKDYK